MDSELLSEWLKQGQYLAFGQLFKISCTAPLNSDVMTEQPSVHIPTQSYKERPNFWSRSITQCANATPVNDASRWRR